MDGMGKPKNLVEHGIQTEESDYRLHISFFTGTAYIFPTKCGREAVLSGLGEKFEASQKGTNKTTGKGRKINWKLIKDCKEIKIPDGWLENVGYKKETFFHKSTSEKGRAAEQISEMLLRGGHVPLPLESKFITNKDIQKRGKDFVVKARICIESKCDSWGGHTGLRLQTAEINPFKRF